MQLGKAGFGAGIGEIDRAADEHGERLGDLLAREPRAGDMGLALGVVGVLAAERRLACAEAPDADATGLQRACDGLREALQRIVRVRLGDRRVRRECGERLRLIAAVRLRAPSRRRVRSARNPCRTSMKASSMASAATAAAATSASRVLRATKPMNSSSGTAISTSQPCAARPGTVVAMVRWRVPATSIVRRPGPSTRTMSKARVSTGSLSSSSRTGASRSPTCLMVRSASGKATSVPRRSMIIARPVLPIVSPARKALSASRRMSAPNTPLSSPVSSRIATETVSPGTLSVKKT